MRLHRFGIDEAASLRHGRESGIVLTVDYTPGAISGPYVHLGSVIANALEGTVVTQLEGEQGRTAQTPRVPPVAGRRGDQSAGELTRRWEVIIFSPA
jgi:hypothetical protein